MAAGARRGWTVAHAHAFREGDWVLLASSSPRVLELALCKIPAQGQTFDPIAARFSTSDPSTLLQVASEARGTTVSSEKLSFDTPDLRGGTIIAADQAGDVITVVIEAGGAHHHAVIMPLGWDVGAPRTMLIESGAGVDSPAAGFEEFSTGGGAKSIVKESATYRVAAGRLANRAIVRVVHSGAATGETKVTDGWFATVLKSPGANLGQETRWQAFDQAGTKVSEGTW